MTETGPNLTDCNRNRRLQLTGLYDLSVAGFTLCQKKHDREKPVITGCDRFFNEGYRKTLRDLRWTEANRGLPIKPKPKW